MSREGAPRTLRVAVVLDFGSENSEEDLKGADVTLMFTFFNSVFKNKPEGNTNGHVRRMGLFGEVADEIFYPALSRLGVLRYACEI